MSKVKSSILAFVIPFSLSATSSGAPIFQWYETHPTEAEKNALRLNRRVNGGADIYVYATDLNSGTTLVMDMLARREPTEDEKAQNVVASWTTALPRTLKRSVRRGDPVRYEDFGF